MLVARWYQSPAAFCGAAPGSGVAADNTVAPTIDDVTPQLGETLTCDPGTWAGTAPINYSYQWFYWMADVGGVPVGAAILGETGPTYELGGTGGPLGPPPGTPMGLLLLFTHP